MCSRMGDDILDDYKVMYDDEIKVGMTGELTKRVTDDDVDSFAKVTGDCNPIHMDNDFAKQSNYLGRVAHGMLSAGLISACLGNKMPGPGAVYINQDLNFHKSVFIGDVLIVTCKVINIKDNGDSKIVTLDTKVTNQDGDIVTDGHAIMKPANRNE